MLATSSPKETHLSPLAKTPTTFAYPSPPSNPTSKTSTSSHTRPLPSLQLLLHLHLIKSPPSIASTTNLTVPPLHQTSPTILTTTTSPMLPMKLPSRTRSPPLPNRNSTSVPNSVLLAIFAPEPSNKNRVTFDHEPASRNSVTHQLFDAMTPIHVHHPPHLLSLEPMSPSNHQLLRHPIRTYQSTRNGNLVQ